MEITTMLASNDVVEHKNPKEVTTTAMKVFFNITRSWGLKAQEEKVLLGEPANSTFYKWRNGEGPALSRDTLERVSYVMGIYKALRLLFPTEEQANAWPRKPSRDFGNESALNVMLKGSVTNLSDVRRYLDGMRG
ncbi:MAG: MbcA/ParS/Xre antitoxin family protein [Pseudomonas sp.]